MSRDQRHSGELVQGLVGTMVGQLEGQLRVFLEQYTEEGSLNLRSFHSWSSRIITWLPAKETCAHMLVSPLRGFSEVASIYCVPIVYHRHLGKNPEKKAGRNPNTVENGASQI